MRVLTVTHNYPRFPGDPAGAYVARLAVTIQSQANVVRVVAPHAPGAPPLETTQGVAVERFRYGPDSLERVGYRGDTRTAAWLSPRTLGMLPAYFWRFHRTLRRATAAFQPDVIHAHWWFPAGWLVADCGVPFVVTSHGSDVRLLDRSGVWRSLARPVLRRAGALTAVSRFLARDLERHAGRPVQVTPMPVDSALFAAGAGTPKAHPPRILYAGNLVPSKGVDVAIAAVATLRRRGVDCRFRILGEGPARPALETLAGTLGVADRIEWGRFVPQPQMPQEYGASTVTVLPSRGQAEGLGLTLVEALLAGSAVVGTPAGGIPEVVIDGETGLLARDGDAAHLADQLERLLTDPALRDRLTAAGRRHVQHDYAPETAGAKFLELYESIRDRHPTR
jgi:phosphatidyl-myo-inositol dimannoside synthase